MKLLLDTNAVIWAAFDPNRISEPIRRLLSDTGNQLSYSVTALWEIAIKNGTRRALQINSLQIDPFQFRNLLQGAGFAEVPITAEHTLGTAQLPRLHGDPFDRILLAQAVIEDMTLITSDRTMLQYPGIAMLAV